MAWALQDAKSRFSSVVDVAWRGKPQVVTRRGKPIVAAISYKLFESKIQGRKKRNIIKALMGGPKDVDLASLIPPRSRDSGRATPIDFG